MFSSLWVMLELPDEIGRDSRLLMIMKRSGNGVLHEKSLVWHFLAKPRFRFPH